MKSKSIILTAVMAFAAFSSASFASDTTGKFLLAPAAEANFYPANPEALKAFLAHPTYCSIYVGDNAEPDALSNDYSLAVSRLIPPQADMDGVRMILSSVRIACLSKLLTVSN
jgi:hypothetical protein